jgi:hypothetical protein
MAVHEIIVTDVTCYGTLYCVAGWDRNAGRMIRPEPSTSNAAVEASRFWGAQHSGPGKVFDVGNIVRLEASPAPAQFPFPHATEDRLVLAGRPITIVEQISLSQVSKQVAAGVATSLKATFNGALVRAQSGKAYVPAGNNGGSLDAIERTPNQITLFENDSGSKMQLRALIVDKGVSYDFSVTGDAAKTLWKKKGLKALEARLKDCDRVHVRLGLSRPLQAMPDKCYAQINGLYFL